MLLETIFLIFFCFYYYFTRTFNYWKERNVIGPKPVPLFGNMKEFTFRKKNLATIFKKYYDNFPNEKIVGIFRMTTPCLLIRDPEIIKHILIKDFDTFVDRGMEFSTKGLGANLFHADGNTWRLLRNRFTPIFTSSKLKNMLYLMTECGDKFIDYIESVCIKNPEQEIYTLLQNYTNATIAACAFGLDMDFINNEREKLNKIDKLFTTANITVELTMMYPSILKKIGGSLFPAYVKNFFSDLVNTVIAQRKGMPTNRNDFMDLMLEMKEQGEIKGRYDHVEDKVLKINKDIITVQAFVFYAAGYVTSTVTMVFMLYQLALNPNIQIRLIKEIDEVLQKYNGEITYESINKLQYLDQVLKETLRMYSVTDPMQRKAHADYKLPGTEVTVTKGQTVLISTAGLHYDEKYFPNSEKFDPGRFAPENENNNPPCTYIPFGAGPRNCIGMRFAQIQTRVCIMKMLSKFLVETSNKTKKPLDFEPRRLILLNKGGIYLNVIPRS